MGATRPNRPAGGRPARRPAPAARGATRTQRVREPVAWGRLFRMLMLGVGTAVVVACISVAVLTVKKMEFPVKRVAIHGNFVHVSRDRVAATIEPYASVGFFAVDLDAIKIELEKLDWVYSANVRRVWPDGLVVKIVEQTPIARWGDHALINRAGGVFAPADMQQIGDLPMLRGPERSAGALMHNYREFTQLLRPLGLSLKALEMDAKGAFTVYVGDGIPVILGTHQTMDKMRRFAWVYGAKLNQNMNNVERVDLRYTNGLAVKWRPKAQELPATSLVHGAPVANDANASAQEEQTSSP